MLPKIAKWIIAIIGILVGVSAGAVLLLWFLLGGTKYVASDIVDFHPTQFQGQAEAAFFFSIGDELKYSNDINPHAATVTRPYR